MRLTAVLALMLSACAPEHMVLGRPYELSGPRGDDGTPLPLLILAHGYGASGIEQDFVFPFSKSREEKRFLYAEPNGTLDRDGRRFWNATDACCNFEQLAVDDVTFFRALIDDVKATHPVSRVFIVGHSNGAFMALRLACEAPDAFDGIAAVSGSTWNDFSRCSAGRAIPILLVHGTVDETIPYEGKPGKYPAATVTFDRFAQRAGCAEPREERERADFIKALPDAETNRQRATGCPARSAVELWSIEGEGHVPRVDTRWTNATFDWLEEHSR